MLQITEALERILADVPPCATENIPLSQAFRRISGAELKASLAVPPWDNSAMDGYAVRHADCSEGCRLKVVGEGAAGRPYVGTLQPGEATEIMTGAPVPDGADAVVMVENTDGGEGGWVTIRLPPPLGNNIRRKGNDIAPGDVLLRKGQRITPGVAGLLASVGVTEVEVSRRPRVAILPTGDELVEPGGSLGPGQIFSSNSIALAALIEEAGAVPVRLDIAPDHMDGLVAAMEEGLQADVLLTTGGVSVGKYDLVKDAFEILGIPMGFWKVRMKPGKPLAFGMAEREGRKVPVFGLPGNPVSCMVNFLQFVRPWIGISLGVDRPYLPFVEATALEAISERPGRAKLLRVILEQTPSGWACRSTGSQSSGVLRSMAEAHGLLYRTPEEGGVSEGERVRVQLLDPGFLDGAVSGF